MKRILLLITAATLTVMTVNAQQTVSVTDTTAKSLSHVVEQADAAKQVVADTDSLTPAKAAESSARGRFLPAGKRIDRNVDKHKMLYRGEFMIGLSASYGRLNASDADYMLILDGLDFNLNRLAVKPSFAYAYRDNRSIGLRVGYESLNGNIGNLSLNLGSLAEGLGLSNYDAKSESFSCSLFHRNYMAFDRRGIVGAVLESELKVKSGTMTILSGAGDSVDTYVGNNFAAKLSLNPGLAVYVFPNVCVSVTVGIGGLYYNYVRQYDADGIELGRRDASGLQFKLSVSDIQFGVVVHLWNQKKS